MTGQAQAPPADSVRAALREVFAAREYDWTERRGVFTWIREQYLRLLDWFAGLEQAQPVLYYFLLIVMVLVLLAILVHLAYVLTRALRYREKPVAEGRPAPAAARDAAWYAAEARRLAAAGRYADAIGHRFLGLVLELERRKIVTFHPSKTPAEYATEARLDVDSRYAFRDLVRRLYSYLFGGLPAGDDVWLDFERRAADLGSRGAAG